MVPVKQLGEVSWSAVCAVCCHMALVFAVVHLATYYFNFFLLLLVISFFYTFKKNSGIDKSTEWSTIPACPSLMCFFF